MNDPQEFRFRDRMRCLIFDDLMNLRSWSTRRSLVPFRDAIRAIWNEDHLTRPINLQSTVSEVLRWLIDRCHTNVVYRLVLKCEFCGSTTFGTHEIKYRWLPINYPPPGADGFNLLDLMEEDATLKV